MNVITKGKIEDFMSYYHYFHDSSINVVNYNHSKATVEMFVDIYWSGEPTLNDDGSYDTHKTKMRMVFTGVVSFKDTQEYNYIDDAVVECYERDGRSLISFSLLSSYSNEEPYLNIICEKIEYEIIND